MATYEQPSLFEDIDRERRENNPYHRPATCPACGTREPNGYLLSNNHGIEPDGHGGVGNFPVGEHPIYGAMCTAQYLVSNHITYAAKHGEAERLARRQQRGRELGLDVEAITARALKEATYRAGRGPHAGRGEGLRPSRSPCDTPQCSCAADGRRPPAGGSTTHRAVLRS
jgi:hypothetical protein